MTRKFQNPVRLHDGLMEHLNLTDRSKAVRRNKITSVRGREAFVVPWQLFNEQNEEANPTQRQKNTQRSVSFNYF